MVKENRGGKREGAGKKKGYTSPRVVERNKMLKQFRDKAARQAQTLLFVQLQSAMGTYSLIRIDDEYKENKEGKLEKTGKRKYVVVTDKVEIEKVFNEFQDVDSSGVVDDKYYFMSHDKPNNNAADSILDRTFGRAQQSVDLTSEGKEIKTNTIIIKDFSDGAENK